MAIDDKKLLSEVFAKCKTDPRKLRLLDTFEDPKGMVWSVGQPMPKIGGPDQPDVYRVLSLFYTGADRNDVCAYCVPMPDKYPVQGFRVFRMHRVGGSMGVERMTQEVFVEALGDELLDLEERMLGDATPTADDLADLLEEKGLLGRPEIDALLSELDGDPPPPPPPNGATAATATPT